MFRSNQYIVCIVKAHGVSKNGDMKDATKCGVTQASKVSEEAEKTERERKQSFATWLYWEQIVVMV